MAAIQLGQGMGECDPSLLGGLILPRIFWYIARFLRSSTVAQRRDVAEQQRRAQECGTRWGKSSQLSHMQFLLEAL
jgi:hypothetical protein